MNPLTVISIVFFLLYFQLGIITWIKNKASMLNRSYFATCVLLGLWSFFTGLSHATENPEQAYLFNAFASIGYFFLPLSIFAFTISLNIKTKISQKQTMYMAVIALAAIILIYNALMGFYFSVEQIQKKSLGWYFGYNPKNMYVITYYIYIFTAGFAVLYNLHTWKKNITEKKEKLQFYILFAAFAIFFAANSVFDFGLRLMHIEVNPAMTQVLTLTLIGSTSFVIHKLRLTDSLHHIVSKKIIDEIKEIILFVDPYFNIVRTNSFTCTLLETQTCSGNLNGKLVFDFFDSNALVAGYMQKAMERKQMGPIETIIINAKKEPIEVSLYFLAIKDEYGDNLGCLIYGHDNREAISLQKEIMIRQQAEQNLRSISEVLEERVQERSLDLANSYKELQLQIAERVRVEEQIKTDIIEKEVLINEIHNRVKNNMGMIISLIESQNKNIASKVVSTKFKELANRVKSLLSIHQNLYLSINYSDVDFSNFITSIYPELLRFHQKEDIVEIETHLSDVFMDIDYAIPCGTIVSELISNALNYGFTKQYLSKHPELKPKIIISYSFQKDEYEIEVADNGKGLPKNFDISELNTNGLVLVDILVRDQVNGKLNIHSSGEGTTVRLNFKASK